MAFGYAKQVSCRGHVENMLVQAGWDSRNSWRPGWTCSCSGASSVVVAATSPHLTSTSGTNEPQHVVDVTMRTAVVADGTRGASLPTVMHLLCRARKIHLFLENWSIGCATAVHKSSPILLSASCSWLSQHCDGSSRSRGNSIARPSLTTSCPAGVSTPPTKLFAPSGTSPASAVATTRAPASSGTAHSRTFHTTPRTTSHAASALTTAVQVA
mmetsp:Transcript_54067/g.123919  ORF Transcript_54067/g.123919 Transcript_54067/m.123919 type:complete len:213 (-) Transcript_54067:33-671(-)